MFVNTALIAPIVYGNDIYGSDALIAEAYNIVLANAILSPLLQFFAPFYYLKKLRRYLAEKNGERSSITQLAAHMLMQGTPVDMARRNANIMKTFLLAMYYSPILPIVWPITALSLVAEYWIAKYLLLRRHCRPDNLGNDLD